MFRPARAAAIEKAGGKVELIDVVSAAESKKPSTAPSQKAKAADKEAKKAAAKA